MKTTTIQLVAAFAAFILSTTTVRPPCDTLDGPVVQNAKLALQEGKVTSVLKWVKREDQKKIRDTFANPVIAPNNEAPWRAVTISRQSGAGRDAVAERLSEYPQS